MIASDASRVERSRSAVIVLWIAQIAVASLVLLTGASKLASAPAMVVEFDAIGVGQWFRYVVGSIEAASAVLLAIPSLAAFGALLLIPIMIGAVGAHLFTLGGSPAPAMGVLVVSLGIAWARRELFAFRDLYLPDLPDLPDPLNQETCVEIHHWFPEGSATPPRLSAWHVSSPPADHCSGWWPPCWPLT